MSWFGAIGNRGSRTCALVRDRSSCAACRSGRCQKGNLLYERRNGHFVLQITGHPEFGVPFGQDRIVPIFLATLAVRQKSQTIRFRSAAEMLETFGMQKGGKEYRRLVAAFERIFGATMFFGTESTTSKARVVQRSRFNFLREAQIWYNRISGQMHGLRRVRERDRAERRVLQGNYVASGADGSRSGEGADGIARAAGPVHVAVLPLLCGQRGGIDSDLRADGFGCADRIGGVRPAARRLREKLEEWLETIRVMWPECPARISADGECLIVAPASAVLSRGLDLL